MNELSQRAIMDGKTDLFIALIFLGAGFAQGLSGFGSALLAMPLLTLFIKVKTAVPLCMLNGVIITLFLSLQLKRHMDWQKIGPLLTGCLPGIWVGVFFLLHTRDGIMKLLLGVMLISYALYSLTFRPPSQKIHAFWPSYLAGFATGVISASFSAGGPPTVIYATLTDWSKDDIKATLSGFFFVTGLFAAVAHFMSGLITGEVLHYFSVSLVFVLLGVYLGSICYGRIKKDTFIKIMLIILMMMGTMMISSLWGNNR